jgi:hypothetical protein
MWRVNIYLWSCLDFCGTWWVIFLPTWMAAWSSDWSTSSTLGDNSLRLVYPLFMILLVFCGCVHLCYAYSECKLLWIVSSWYYIMSNKVSLENAILLSSTKQTRMSEDFFNYPSILSIYIIHYSWIRIEGRYPLCLGLKIDWTFGYKLFDVYFYSWPRKQVHHSDSSMEF